MDFINYNGKSYDAYGRIYSSIGNQNFHYKFVSLNLLRIIMYFNDSR